MSGTYWIYILASRSRNLYAGVTNDLQRRMIEHRQGLVFGFTSRYGIFRLVHCEPFADIRDAIAREKEIKGWRREKKIWLIERDNPYLGGFGGEFCAGAKSEKRKADPSPPSPKTGTGFGMTIWVVTDRNGNRVAAELCPRF